MIQRSFYDVYISHITYSAAAHSSYVTCTHDVSLILWCVHITHHSFGCRPFVIYNIYTWHTIYTHDISLIVWCIYIIHHIITWHIAYSSAAHSPVYFFLNMHSPTCRRRETWNDILKCVFIILFEGGQKGSCVDAVESMGGETRDSSTVASPRGNYARTCIPLPSSPLRVSLSFKGIFLLKIWYVHIYIYIYT